MYLIPKIIIKKRLFKEKKLAVSGFGCIIIYMSCHITNFKVTIKEQTAFQLTYYWYLVIYSEQRVCYTSRQNTLHPRHQHSNVVTVKVPNALGRIKIK